MIIVAVILVEWLVIVHAVELVIVDAIMVAILLVKGLAREVVIIHATIHAVAHVAVCVPRVVWEPQLSFD